MNIWIKETGSKEVVGKNQKTRVFRMHFLELEVYHRNFFSTCKRIPAGGARRSFGYNERSLRYKIICIVIAVIMIE